MTPPTASAEHVEFAEAEIDLVPEGAAIRDEELEVDDTDGVLDLTDRRRVLLQVVFGVDVPPTELDDVFCPSNSPGGD